MVHIVDIIISITIFEALTTTPGDFIDTILELIELVQLFIASIPLIIIRAMSGMNQIVAVKELVMFNLLRAKNIGWEALRNFITFIDGSMAIQTSYVGRSILSLLTMCIIYCGLVHLSSDKTSYLLYGARFGICMAIYEAFGVNYNGLSTFLKDLLTQTSLGALGTVTDFLEKEKRVAAVRDYFQ